jgi:hypothetical protein
MKIQRVLGLVGAILTASAAQSDPGFDIRFSARDNPERTAEAGETVVLQLRLFDKVTDYPLSGLHPGAWIRPARAGRSACRTAIGAYLAAGANSSRDQDLNGYRFVLLGADASLSVIDPRLDLASSNVLWLQLLDEMPSDWVFDHLQARVFISLVEKGRVIAHDLLRGERLWESSIAGAAQLFRFPGRDRLWVTRDGHPEVQVLDERTGDLLQRIALQSSVVAAVADSDGERLLVLESDRVEIIDAKSGQIVGSHMLERPAGHIAYSPKGNAIALASAGTVALEIVFLDDPGVGRAVSLAAPAQRLLTSEDGRWLFALDNAGGTVSVMDWAQLQLRHALVFPGLPDQMAVSEDYLYLRETKAPRIALVHIPSLERVTEPGVLDVALGSKGPEHGLWDSRLPAIAPLPEGGGTLIVGEADRTLFLYMETGMQAPSNAFRIWASPPRAVAVHDRPLTETRPGVYQTALRFPYAGRYELLLHLAQPPFTACQTFDVEGEGAMVEAVHALPRVELDPVTDVTAGRPLSLRVRVSTSLGSPLDELGDVEMMVMGSGNNFHWRGVGRFANGAYQFELVPPRSGQYRVFVRSHAGRFGYEDSHFPTLEVQPGPLP